MIMPRYKYQVDWHHTGDGQPTQAQIDLLKPFARELPTIKPDEKYNSARYFTYEGDPLSAQQVLGKLGDVKLKGEDLPVTAWEVVWDKLVALEKAMAIPPAVYNEKCAVVQPDNALMKVRTLYVEQDCCSDHANDLLGKGWMILAICPQPDQRRPDYVFGRFDRV